MQEYTFIVGARHPGRVGYALYGAVFAGGAKLTCLDSGEAHRRQRKMLTPVFSEANLRNLTPVFYEVAHRVRNPCNRPFLNTTWAHGNCPARGGYLEEFTGRI